MRRLLALFTLSSLIVIGQELPEREAFSDLPALLPDPESLKIPEIPTGPAAGDPLADILSSDRPERRQPKGVKITGKNVKPRYNNVGGNPVFTYDGRIRIKADTGMEAYANHAVYDGGAQSITMTGNVSIYLDGLLYRGHRAVYDLKNRQLDTSGLRVGLGPILAEAGKFKTVKRNGKNVFIGENAGVTTHDVENPDFWLRSKRTTVFPGEKVIFKNFTLKAGDRNLFWLPYLAQPLDKDLGFLLYPGGRSNLGVYLKSRYGVMLGGTRDPETGENEDAWLLSQWHADLYSLRGAGVGVDLFDTRLDPKDHFGWLKLYHIHDFNSDLERAGVERRNVTDERYRVELAQRIPLWESLVAKYSFEANLTLLSDEFYLEDFDPSQFRVNRAPDNFIGLTRRSANSQTTLGARLRLNNFYQSDTRLPELTHDWIRQPLFNSKILYESQTSLGFYEEHFDRFQRDGLRREAEALLPGDPRIAEIDRLLGDRGFARFHTYHEVSRPIKAGHFNITPRVGAGHTTYRSVLDEDDPTSRSHFAAGIDVSTKLSKSYPDIVDKKWGLDGVRHIIQPYASMSWLTTNELDSSFATIDRLTPSTRPRARHVGRFNAVDDLQNWRVLRTGVRNRLVTRRDEGTHDWLTLDTYFDTFFEDPEFDRDFSNLYNDLRWDPLPWLSLDLETQFPLFTDSNFTEVAAGLRVQPHKNLELQVDYRHLNNHPVLRDSDRLVLESFARLNEYWGIGTYHRFEFQDSTLELQQYNIHYDFDSFVGSIGFFHRNNRSDDEYGVMFSFGLKEIPSLSLPIRIGAE